MRFFFSTRKMRVAFDTSCQRPVASLYGKESETGCANCGAPPLENQSAIGLANGNPAYTTALRSLVDGSGLFWFTMSKLQQRLMFAPLTANEGGATPHFQVGHQTLRTSYVVGTAKGLETCALHLVFGLYDLCG
jgi:hypothetical protein